MKALLKSLIAVILLTSCSTDEKSAGNQSGIKAPEPVLIGKGNLYGNGQEGIPLQFLVITDEAQWEAIKLQMNTVNPATDDFSETAIDFNNWTIIAVFDQIRETGGHSIDIIEVDENPDIIHITVGKLLNGDMTAVMTQPYHIIRIPATDKQIVFN